MAMHNPGTEIAIMTEKCTIAVEQCLGRLAIQRNTRVYASVAEEKAANPSAEFQPFQHPKVLLGHGGPEVGHEVRQCAASRLDAVALDGLGTAPGGEPLEQAIAVQSIAASLEHVEVMIALQQDRIEALLQLGRPEEIQHLSTMKAPVHVVAQEHNVRPLDRAVSRMRLDPVEQATQLVGATMDVADRVNHGEIR